MLIGVMADDFTGAGDIANTLSRGLPDEGGLATVQFNGLPEGPAPEGTEVAGKSLEDAVWAAEELEESAKLFFLLTGHRTRLLDAAKIAELDEVFPS